MPRTTAGMKAAIIATLFAVPLAAMVAVPVWFVLAFLSRIITGGIHPTTFVIAGAAAVVFMVWVFRMVFDYFRAGYARDSARVR